MNTPRYYESEAARCRELAARSPGTDAARRWLQLAAEYDDIAATLQTMPDKPGVMHAPMQQQSLQQQQSRKKEDEA
jgi:hypothetical protein